MNPSLRILIIDDEEVVHTTLGDYLKDLNHEVHHASDGPSGLVCTKTQFFDVVLLDVRMPRMDGLSVLEEAKDRCPDTSFVIITAYADVETAIQAIRLGAADFLIKPIKLLELEAVLEKSMALRRLHEQNRRYRNTIRGLLAGEEARRGGHRFVGVSQATVKIRKQIRAVTESKCDTILITGETGVGKEVVAREIHRHLFADEQPFIAVSCPALADSLIESELFGHVKGAFTGATEYRSGCFEQADGGLLFLDEVADLSQSAQATLLRALETRKIRPVGGVREITVSLCLVAATNAELSTLLERGKFRKDLFYRLDIYPIHVSPLRERRADIVPLAEHFLASAQTRKQPLGKRLSTEAAELLGDYDFPGNARELRNIIERATVVCGGRQILPEHLSLPAPRPSIQPSTGDQDSAADKARIEEALLESHWNRRQAACRLGMPYSTFRYKLNKYGLN